MFEFPYPSQRPAVIAKNIVSTSQPLASQAGLRMLLEGGNAVDAALAAAIALTIVEPTGNGMGSDAFGLIWDGHELHGINGSGCSPRAWNYGRFAHLEKMNQHGWDSVTGPGAVSVWSELSKRCGKLGFKKLFEPAIAYARDGFCVTPHIARKWKDAATPLQGFEEFSRVFLPGGNPPSAGSIFTFKDAASTLEEIRDTEGESFYRGDLAQMIARCSEEYGGALRFDDLASHQPQWVVPQSMRYRGVDIYELPPNSQGLAVLIALGILEQLDVSSYPVDSPDSIHLQVEAMKLAFADVFQHVSDPHYMRTNFKRLLEPAYLEKRTELIDLKRAASYTTGIPLEGGTVYLAAADCNGMMVSFIQSNYQGFGSGIVIPQTGISLNNRGYGFNIDERHPNCVAGGKRPFHTIIPGFAMARGKPLMAFGVMGAHMQAQGHVQMMTRIFDYGQNPQAASDAPRWQVLPNDDLALEPEVDGAIKEELSQRGHNVVTENHEIFGGAQLLLKMKDHYMAGSDHRKDGQAVGY